MTRAILALTAHSLRRVGGLVLAMTIVLAIFQVLLAFAAAYLHHSGAFQQLSDILPPFVRQLMGPALIAMLSVSGILALGYFHTAVEAALVGLVIAVATEPAAEIETGFADFALARPIARQVPLTRTVLLLVGCATFAILAMVAGTTAGVQWILPPEAARPSVRNFASIALNLWALLLAWGGISLAFASFARRRSTAATSVALLALAGALIDYLGRAWAPAQTAARLSPFHYYNPLEMVMGAPLAPAHVEILLGTAVVGIAVAYAAFARRDL